MHDGKGSLEFLEELFVQFHDTLKHRQVLEMRMDGAFFREDVLDLLEDEGVEYGIKVPFFHWLRLKEHIVKQRRWTRVDERVECFERRLRVKTWGRRSMRFVIYRTKVADYTRKNFQLDLFDPDDGHYEYSRPESANDWFWPDKVRQISGTHVVEAQSGDVMIHLTASL